MEFEDKYVPAELCLPGQHPRGAIAPQALLDSGAHLTSLSLPIVEMMERLFPGVQMRVPFSLGARQARHGDWAGSFRHGAHYSAAVGARDSLGAGTVASDLV